ncbi:MAG: hypothetical protein ACJ746_30995 [Bryobacteraceae bacterium]
MRHFTLRVFQPLKPARISGLALIGETQLTASTAEEGKRKLSEWIDGRVLERERFYRFEGYAPFRGGRPQFVLNISFYLFEDGRLCPLRILAPLRTSQQPDRRIRLAGRLQRYSWLVSHRFH